MPERLDDDTLCEDMLCPFVFVHENCSPAYCHAADLVRKKVGAIYMIDDNDDEHFVGLLPGSLSS